MNHIVIVMTCGYWGKGASIALAAKNCHEAGGHKTEHSLARLIIASDLPDLEKHVSVNGCGDIVYPAQCKVIPLFSPKNSKVRLGSLLDKTKSAKGDPIQP